MRARKRSYLLRKIKPRREANEIEVKRKYVSIDDVAREYLPISKKKIRSFVKRYMPVKFIGGRMYVERELLERLLSDTERESFPLD